MKAIFSGSFDPFTNGHLDIVKQACELFDELHIVIANNYLKNKRFTIDTMLVAIELTLKDIGIDNCIVTYHSGLIADYCKNNDIHYSVRGLRNNMDYNYEESIAIINQEFIPDLKTIYFRADNSCISSSMVKELFYYGKKVDKYVPKEVVNAMVNGW